MKDILHPACLVIASAGFLILLRDLIKKDRRDPALVALAFTYLCSAVSYAVSMTWVWMYIDRTTGVTNISVPLAQCAVILVFALQAIVLAHWSRPLAEARRRARGLLIAAAVVIVGMVSLFVLLTPATTRPVDFSTYYAHDPFYQAYVLLYFGTYTVAEVYLAWSCWKYARTAARPSITWGLRLISVGAVITLGYSTIRISAIVGAEVGFSVEHLNPFAWACGDIGATLTQIGYFLPVIAMRSTAVRDWFVEHYRYSRLHPLWQALSAADPGIVMEQPPEQRGELRERRRMDFHLLRHRVEIRDGQRVLRPYLSPGARGEAEARRRAEGLTDAKLAAAVTADQIRHAIVLHQQGKPVTTQAEYADAGLSLPTVTDEFRHLLRVASYFKAPPPETPSELPSPSTVPGART
ncbi:MAB_1171c family putative transporter [Streptomyces sp. NPDC056099]|uniref:MAB_1171c family putative transporter n=1 Tax=unclassified Streptomyces TaxID=2593676 RepID=UPI0035D98DEA